MIPNSDLRQRLSTLVSPNGSDPERLHQDLEGRLRPLVRLALRKHAGAPALVDWVQTTFSRITDGERAAPPEHFTPQITHLLCAALLADSRPNPSHPRGRDPRAAW